MSAPQGMNAPTSFSTRRRIGALRLAARNIPISPPMEVPTQSIMGGGGPPRSRSSQVPAAGALTPPTTPPPPARRGGKTYFGSVFLPAPCPPPPAHPHPPR